MSEVNNNSRVSYFEQCFHYIHQNPVVARLVEKLSDWPYSSYGEYVGFNENGSGRLKRPDPMCRKEIFYSLTGMSGKDIIEKTKEGLKQKILDKLF